MVLFYCSKYYRPSHSNRQSTTDQIIALKQLMTKYYEFGKDLHLVFMDYKRGYMDGWIYECRQR